MKKQALSSLVEAKLTEFGIGNQWSVAVAVSGGPDSMVLLDILRKLALAELVVVHINHGLRKTAMRDQKVVEEYCAKWNLKVMIVTVDVVGRLGAKGGGVEEKARELRYKALRSAANKAGAAVIVLAHTADDQAETVLFNWIRGSGIRGWGGMREVNDDLWRPLLGASKQAILEYASRYKIFFAKDESNDSLQFTRNRIRKEVLPVLRKINPGVDDQLVRTAHMAQETERAVRDLARLYLLAIVKTEKEKVILDRSKLSELTEFMQAEVIKLAVGTLAPNLVEWSGAKFGQIAKLLASSAPAGTKVIDRTLVVVKSYDKITFSLNH